MTASTAPPSAATSRDAEAALLARCCAAARGDAAAARNQREANAFRVAAMLMYTRFPSEYARLMRVADSYFAAHPGDLLEAAEVLRRGWTPSLPRLRDMLERALSNHRNTNHA